ncbi:hypothetical protein HYPSUDRAFT_210156 [Hypholoma sublateritium FD-334 SS-4]|uniref:Uncharacterized protein n=1 Tax=Hypholoma sublateritium (strain FD-334 SS-4) TaxID=945553 RepID=A0A0D2NW29_HYPSF|nr:hypothetical protein HYPSUDRAFT_210156 [Hypholoma sublateritium FD-334 SS-4]
MTSSSHAFARALSPHLEGITSAIISNTMLTGNANDEPNHTVACNELIRSLHQRVSSARSVEALVECVYPDYRAEVKVWLFEYSAWADKLESTRSVHQRMATSVARGDTPQRLRTKAPEVQFTTDFRDSGTEASTKALHDLSDAANTFQDTFTRVVVAAKKAELDFWVDRTAPTSMSEPFRLLVENTYDSKKKMFKIPTFLSNEDGHPTLGAFVYSPQKEMEAKVLSTCGPIFASQILDIVAARHRVLNKKVEKKREVAEKADVEMADATKPGPSIQSLVDRAINARLKNLSVSSGGKKTSSGPSTPKTNPGKNTPAQKAAQSKKAQQKKAPGKGPRPKASGSNKAAQPKPKDRKGKGKAK